mmetsp:Transcript_19933/g.64895  ORF Transcript_19933/g.64895 Transcript_19933/m.64895 type:complete len:209 (-) Transcript_19933:878-1504(-)
MPEKRSMRTLFSGITSRLSFFTFSVSARSAERAASSSPWKTSSVLRSFVSHCIMTSTTVSSETGICGASILMPSSLSARCSVPAFMAMRMRATRSNLRRERSHLPLLSRSCCSYSSTMRRLPAAPAPEYFTSSMRALVASRSSLSPSMRPCASFVIDIKFFVVSSCVMNFWITSLTSDTPVASLIFRKASSNVVTRFCSSAIFASFSA